MTSGLGLGCSGSIDGNFIKQTIEQVMQPGMMRVFPNQLIADVNSMTTRATSCG